MNIFNINFTNIISRMTYVYIIPLRLDVSPQKLEIIFEYLRIIEKSQHCSHTEIACCQGNQSY